MRRATIAIAVLALVVAGLAVMLRPGARGEDELLMLCGGSMRAAMEEVVRRYREAGGAEVLTTYGGSGELCAQIQNTRRGDIYVCHDPFMPWAQEQGLINTWRPVARLDIVIVVPRGNPKSIGGLEDLARPGLRLGMGDTQYSTSGVMAKHMLAKLPYGEDIRRNVRLETKGHQQRCNDVAMGTLDAAIVWNAVAHQFREKLDAIPIPKDHLDAVTSATYRKSDLKNVNVTIGVISYGVNEDAARRFFEFAATQCGDVFTEHGFTPLEE